MTMKIIRCNRMKSSSCQRGLIPVSRQNFKILFSCVIEEVLMNS
jgi:hypothetical protein